MKTMQLLFTSHFIYFIIEIYAHKKVPKLGNFLFIYLQKKISNWLTVFYYLYFLKNDLEEKQLQLSQNIFKSTANFNIK